MKAIARRLNLLPDLKIPVSLNTFSYMVLGGMALGDPIQFVATAVVVGGSMIMFKRWLNKRK